MQKHIKKMKIGNDLGLHTRPAMEIVKLLQKYKSDVFFTYKGETVNAKSIMSILMLAAKKNAQITVSAEGADAEKALEELSAAFEAQFGEMGVQ